MAWETTFNFGGGLQLARVGSGTRIVVEFKIIESTYEAKDSPKRLLLHYLYVTKYLAIKLFAKMLILVHAYIGALIKWP